jgi:hypothetical protein
LRVGLSRLYSPAISSDHPRRRPSAILAFNFVFTRCSRIRSIAWASGPHQSLLPSIPAMEFSPPASAVSLGEPQYTTSPLIPQLSERRVCGVSAASVRRYLWMRFCRFTEVRQRTFAGVICVFAAPPASASHRQACMKEKVRSPIRKVAIIFYLAARLEAS